MDYRQFSKKELGDILDLIQMSVACRADEDIFKLTGKIKDLVCADHGVCGLGGIASGELANIIKIVNYDYSTEWLSMYAAERLYKNDPIIRFNYERFETHFWSEAITAYNDDSCRDFMKKASDFGLVHGVASGMRDGGSKGSIFSFSSSKNNFRKHHKDILDILTPHVHMALARVGGVRDEKSSPQISEREKEVLNWMKEGKTNWEISVILNISERTVKFHVQNIERKLNAVNKAHAIAIAMDIGLVI
jgi:DNA-binding CsgD family transcriptional regulator